MKTINTRLLAVLASAVSYSAMAVELDLANGISVPVLNGKKVNDDNLDFLEGENQLVFEFAGKLKDNNKRKYYSSRPYIVTLDLTGAKTLKVELVSNKLNKIDRSVNKKQPIFEFTIDGEQVEDSRQMLPPAEGVFPYSNVPLLVENYNKERGLVFDSGKVVELKAGLPS